MAGPAVPPWPDAGKQTQRLLEDMEMEEDLQAGGQQLSDSLTAEFSAGIHYDLVDTLTVYFGMPYSTWPAHWPPVAEIASVAGLPPEVLDRYAAAGEDGNAVVAHCGIFPSIRQAWATVNGAFFLWNFNRSDGSFREYDGGKQILSAVGLAPALPGVFVEGIKHLLVLANPEEVVLVGLCIGRGVGGEDSFDNIILQPLPRFRLPSTGVVMSCVACSDNGRIFLGGKDSHVYELTYNKSTVWGSRCNRICLTATVMSTFKLVLPSVINFGAADSIASITIDEERQIMYALTKASRVLVFDLGKNGDSAKKVVEDAHVGEQNIAKPRRGRRRTRIVALSTISTLESNKAQLVAQMSDGRRVYLSTNPERRGSIEGQERPSTLREITTRAPPNRAVAQAAAGAPPPLPIPDPMTIKTETAMYSSGIFALSDSSRGDPQPSQLLVASRDVTCSSMDGVVTRMGERSRNPFREVLGTVDLAGHALALSTVLPPPELTSSLMPVVSGEEGRPSGSELTRAKRLWAITVLNTQHSLPRRKILAVAGGGITEIAICRPVDTLQKLLELANRDSIKEFFKRYGQGEAAAMCLLLAAGIVYHGDDGQGVVPARVVKGAIEAFEDPELVGLPNLEVAGSFGGGGLAAGGGGGAGGNGFDVGQLVQEPQLQFSGAYDGVRLCAIRILKPVWEYPLAVSKEDAGVKTVTLRLCVEALHAIELKLNALEQFLRSRREQKVGHYGRAWLSGRADKLGIVGRGESQGNKRFRRNLDSSSLLTKEARGIEVIRRVMRLSVEALALLRILGESQFHLLVSRLDDVAQSQLCTLSFRSFVCSHDGHELATKLVAALVEHNLDRKTTDVITAKLKTGCSTFFSEPDYIYYRAYECLERAAAADSFEKDRLVGEAFNMLKHVPQNPEIMKICSRFANFGNYKAVVELPLLRAQYVDPHNLALSDQVDDERRRRTAAKREECYNVILETLRTLRAQQPQEALAHHHFGSPLPAHTITLNPEQRRRFLLEIIQRGIRWPDSLFHEHLYATLVKLDMDKELIELGGPDLESFLRRAGNFTSPSSQKGGASIQLPGRQAIPAEQVKYLELLAKFYARRHKNFLAAHVYLRLAERSQPEGGHTQPGGISLEQRQNYLSDAVLQAKSSEQGDVQDMAFRLKAGERDLNLLQLLNEKLRVLRFQISICNELQRLSARPGGEPIRLKVEELENEMYSLQVLYDIYVLPFCLWAIGLEILHFATHKQQVNDDDDGGQQKVVLQTWRLLIEQALKEGGITEACKQVAHVAERMEPGGKAILPLEVVLWLEQAAQATFNRGLDVGAEIVPRALLLASKDNPEYVQREYERLLSQLTGPLHGTSLRLRLLRSEAYVLHEWVRSLRDHTRTRWQSEWMPSSQGRSFVGDVNEVQRRHIRTIANACSRSIAELQRLSVPQSEKDPVLETLKDVEMTLRSFSISSDSFL